MAGQRFGFDPPPPNLSFSTPAQAPTQTAPRRRTFAEVEAEQSALLDKYEAEQGTGESLWENANRPRWTKPAEWGAQLGEFVEGAPVTSPFDLVRNKVAGAASRFAGNTVSQATSPVGAATLAATALSGGAAAPLLGGRMAAGQAIPFAAGRVAQGIGALQTAHGVGEIGGGLSEGDYGRAGMGAVEVGFGALGLRNPGGKPRPTVGSNVGNVGLQDIGAPPTTTTGIHGTPMQPQGRPVGGPNLAGTSPSLTTQPRTIPLQGQTSPLRAHPRRMLAENTETPPPLPQSQLPGPPRFRAGPAGVEALPQAPLQGVVEKGRVSNVSAGMGGARTPEKEAFEALVPNRYKQSAQGVSSEGLTYNWRGEPVEPPSPGLRLNPQGQLRPEKGFSMSFPQMVDKYGLEEAAQRAGVTAAEAQRLAKGKPLVPAAKPKAKSKYPPPTQTGKAPKKAEATPPEVIAAVKKLQAMTQREAPVAAAPVKQNLGAMKTADLEALAAEGNTQAADILVKRAASPRQPTSLKERLAAAIPERLKNETGSVGPGTGAITRAQKAELRRRQMGKVVEPPPEPRGPGRAPMEPGPEVVRGPERMALWKRMMDETGSVGEGTEDLMRRRALAEEAEVFGDEGIPSRPSSNDERWFNPKKPERLEIDGADENEWVKTHSENARDAEFAEQQSLARDKQNFQRRQEQRPEFFAQDMDNVMKDNPDFSHEEAMDEVFRKFRIRQAELSEQVKAEHAAGQARRANEPPPEEPKWERPPFRNVEDKPYVPEDWNRASPQSTIESAKMVPHKDWYAGQESIDRTQVESVKKYGVSDPRSASRSKPYVTIDTDGSYQIHDGHHRSTAALEQNKGIDMTVEDYSPKDSWFRKTRGMTDSESPFAQAGKDTARKFRSAMDDAESDELGESLYQRLVRQLQSSRLGNETGAVGKNINPIIKEQARIKAARAQAASGGAGRGNPPSPRPGASPPPGGQPPSVGTGAIPKKPAGVGEKVWNAALQARMTAMLSGLAVPKSMLGNVGAHAFASLEGKSLKPLKEMLNTGENWKNLKAGWKAGAVTPDANDLGFSKFNLPGRVMGAFDEMSTKSLMRAGVSEKEAKELLLTAPNAFGESIGGNTPIGRLLVPFQKTPANTFKQGLNRSYKHPLIGAGAGAVGLAAGTQTEDPKKIALASALMGPYALPFLLGALPTAGEKAIQGFSPIPEWSVHKALADPAAPFQKPGFARLFEGKGQDASLFGKEGDLRIFSREKKTGKRSKSSSGRKGRS